MSKYQRTPTELRAKASLFWPAELTAQETSASIIPLLLETQGTFISVLDVSVARPDSWKGVLQSAEPLPANVFLKHLMVLADLGGELLKRLRPELNRLFPTGSMNFMWRGKGYTYPFKAILHAKVLDNKSLYIDGKSLATGRDLDDRMEDVIMLLLHGAAAANAALPEIIQEKCGIGSLMGRLEDLKTYVKLRSAGMKTFMGRMTASEIERQVKDAISTELAQTLPRWRFVRHGAIPGIRQRSDPTNVTFDIVAVSPIDAYAAIEVGIKVNFSSAIERKAGQAPAYAALLRAAECKFAHVIAGVDFFVLEPAIQIISQYSDFLVSSGPNNLDALAEFLQASV